MEIEIPQPPDPTSNLIEMKPRKREPVFEVKRAGYQSCKHEGILVDEELRQVTCRNCETILDAFQVLHEMAARERRWIWDVEEWEARRESMLGERYDRVWEENKDDVTTPPTEPLALAAWETFEAYYQGRFVSMYRRKGRLRSGPEWYGKDDRGTTVSFEYARSQLIPRAVKPTP